MVNLDCVSIAYEEFCITSYKNICVKFVQNNNNNNNNNDNIYIYIYIYIYIGKLNVNVSFREKGFF